MHDRGIYLRSPGAKALAELHLLSAQWATRAMKELITRATTITAPNENDLIIIIIISN